MTPDQERELVRRLREGDPDAFDEVHAAFNSRLFNFLCRLSNRRDVAEDLLEETWMRLVKHAHRLRPDTQLGGWLFTVGRRLYVSYCRSRLLESSHTAQLIGLWPSGSRTASPFESVSSNEFQRRVNAALAALPLHYREALLLVGVEGLRHAEAAVICEVSTDVMRKRVSRGRALLARRLAEARAKTTMALREATT